MFETIRQNSAYRSVRYSTIRKDSHTADRNNRFSQTRVKHKLAEDSTFYKTNTIDLKPHTAINRFDNPENHSYMETFHSLFQSQKTVKLQIEDQFQNCQLKVKFNNFDNSFLKDDGTEYTLLDPFHRPYTHLTNQLRKQQKEMQSQKDDMRLIRAQLSTLRRNALASLRNSEEEGRKGVERLRQALRKNEVESQQTKMRVRREMTQLFERHDDNLRLQEKLSDRSRSMQRDIFSCEPFELQVAAE